MGKLFEVKVGMHENTSQFMEPPAGATLLADLTLASAWSHGESPTTFTPCETRAGSGPQGDPILRNSLVDGQRATWDPTTNERNDYRIDQDLWPGSDGVAVGDERTMLWHERFIEMPTTSQQWQLIGPCEVHAYTQSQAPFQPWVAPTTKKRQLDVTYGSNVHDYKDITTGAIVLNEWHQCMFKVKHTFNTTGWWEFWYDGVLKASAYNVQTTQVNEGGYWKWGNYRHADINGNSTYEISGCRLYVGT
jgi:hypothetical protein